MITNVYASYSKFALLCGILVVSLIFFAKVGSNGSYSLVVSPSTASINNTSSKKCLDGYLFGTHWNGGTGNVIFEYIALLAIASKTNRLPTIRDPRSLDRLNEVIINFPNLRRVLETIQQSQCASFSTKMHSGRDCCKFNAQLSEEIKANTERTIQLTLRYAQSYKYFSNFDRDDILKLLEGTQTAKSLADYHLFERVENRTIHKNLCVHIRRGDFVNNVLMRASEGRFTKKAVSFLLEQESTNSSQAVHVYVMSNDEQWSRGVLKGVNNVHFSHFDSYSPPNAEWEFSKKYCDVVLMTAPTSSYGWWMGYLSRGQTLYFNGDFSDPNGIAKELNPKDYWLPHWTPLLLSTNTSKIEISSFDMFN